MLKVNDENTWTKFLKSIWCLYCLTLETYFTDRFDGCIIFEQVLVGWVAFSRNFWFHFVCVPNK